MLATNVEKWFESAEQRGEQRGRQEGRQEGEGTGMVKAIREMFTLRFPQVDVCAYADKFRSIAETKIAEYGLRIATAKTPEEVFADDEKK